MASEMIPVTVIAGYLGAGKTTLLNALLRAADGRRLAVMINDFGSINIDAELVAGAGDAEGGIVELANGCICCSMGDDLGFALLDLLERRPAPEHIVIEASGIAEPARVRGFLSMMPKLQVEATLVVADATRVEQLAGDKQIGPLFTTQLEAADLLLISKSDLVEQAQLYRTQNWLAQAYPLAPVIETDGGHLPVDILLGPHNNSIREGHAQQQHQHGPSPAKAPRFTSFSFESDKAFDRKRLTDFLDTAPPGLLRAKGFLRLEEEIEPTLILQLVGSRWTLTRSHTELEDGGARLIFIGLEGELEEVALRTSLEHAQSRI